MTPENIDHLIKAGVTVFTLMALCYMWSLEK